jgi:hypothetical protein
MDSWVPLGLEAMPLSGDDAPERALVYSGHVPEALAALECEAQLDRGFAGPAARCAETWTDRPALYPARSCAAAKRLAISEPARFDDRTHPRSEFRSYCVTLERTAIVPRRPRVLGVLCFDLREAAQAATLVARNL